MTSSGEQRSRVLKFGGTALDGPRRLRRAVRLMSRRTQGRSGSTVVVSALTGVTDSLQRAVDVAASGGDGALRTVERIADRHRALLTDVTTEAAAAEGRERLDRRAERLREAVGRVLSSGRCGPALRDEVLSFGERLCAPVVAAALRSAGARAEDRRARRLLVTTDDFGEARLDWSATEEAVVGGLSGRDAIQVVPGFVGASRDRRTTTLGRGGSDLTAVVLGAALGAGSVEIWTDVDGVMTADPSLVPEGRTLAGIGWEEMWVLSCFGADVLQARAAWMARSARIRLRVRNAARPAESGTLVGSEGDGEGREPAVGVASPVRGRSAWTPPVVAGNGDAPTSGLTNPVAVVGADAEECAVVAVVGVRERGEARGRVGDALEAASVPVLAVGQAPAASLALAVPAPDRERAVSVVHAALFEESPARRALGTGGAK